MERIDVATADWSTTMVSGWWGTSTSRTSVLLPDPETPVIATSTATVSKTSDDLPEPETPTNAVICRFGMRTDTSRRLFSRAPVTVMNSVRTPPPDAETWRDRPRVVQKPQRSGE